MAECCCCCAAMAPEASLETETSRAIEADNVEFFIEQARSGNQEIIARLRLGGRFRDPLSYAVIHNSSKVFLYLATNPSWMTHLDLNYVKLFELMPKGIYEPLLLSERAKPIIDHITARLHKTDISSGIDTDTAAKISLYM